MHNKRIEEKKLNKEKRDYLNLKNARCKCLRKETSKAMAKLHDVVEDCNCKGAGIISNGSRNKFLQKKIFL